MDKKFIWVGTAILVLVILATSMAIFYKSANQVFNGSVINPPAPAADFSLNNQTGGTVKLSNYRGKYVLLYFGYSHCTNECPVSMAVLAKARSELSEQQAGQVQAILVSTDPAHDTQQSMKDFLNRFDPTFIGATGDLARLQPIWKDYGVTVLDGGETHSNYIYLIDPAGNIRLTYAYPGTAEEISADLKLLFRKK